MSGRGGVKKGGTRRTLRVPAQRRWYYLEEIEDDRVIHGVVNDVLLPKRRYPENFMMICQLNSVKNGGSRRGVLRVH